MERQSKNEKVNRKSRKLINLIEEMGWSIYNGCTKGDEKGVFTFTAGRGNTVRLYNRRKEDVGQDREDKGRREGGF